MLQERLACEAEGFERAAGDVFTCKIGRDQERKTETEAECLQGAEWLAAPISMLATSTLCPCIGPHQLRQGGGTCLHAAGAGKGGDEFWDGRQGVWKGSHEMRARLCSFQPVIIVWDPMSALLHIAAGPIAQIS